MAFRSFLRSQLEREIEAERKQLRRILEVPDDSGRVDELRALARRLGASTIKVYPGHGEASQPELVQNIHLALQTKAMIAAVQTSSNYVIVTVILTVVAFASMVAALIAAFRPK
jgi:hypothetical protein